ncbi:MAG: signal recognition particle-docking protein FtsY [Cycloclasticus sp. symbiont of Poecilosclerida sp. N]|nr:MAG: signal recognition particle-docking protein FtsY [Cycloclasticus sp. symbiont of Poecilosclerida sp. N]
MFGFGNKKGTNTTDKSPIKETNGSFFGRLNSQLTKTRTRLTTDLSDLFLSKKQIDDDLFEELEMLLLTADVGIEATQQIINNLTQRVARKQLSDPQALTTALQEEMLSILEPNQQPLHIPEGEGTFVILVVGVNGMGKTTTIGKLAKRLQAEGKSVMLAAGDTFRAAAIEQLQEWGMRNNIDVVAQHSGADSASVIYDAFEKARARNIDVLLADTAGRLHTQTNLMNELSKINRVIKKIDEQAPHETMLVLDAGIGQNAVVQTKHFNEATPLTSITLTKLDGTAKGGIIFALANQFNLAIRFIGIGEGIDDLREFNALEFTEALFEKQNVEK